MGMPFPIRWLRSNAINNLLASANYWSANQTFAGANNTAPGQAGQTPASSTLLTKSQADLLYSKKQFKIVPASETVTNSTTLTDSAYLQVSLVAGSYEIEYCLATETATAAANGSKIAVAYSGTTTSENGMRFRSGNTSSSQLNQYVTYDNTVFNLTGSLINSGLSCLEHRRGLLVVSTSGTLKVQFAQWTAGAGTSVSLSRGSYLKATKVL